MKQLLFAVMMIACGPVWAEEAQIPAMECKSYDTGGHVVGDRSNGGIVTIENWKVTIKKAPTGNGEYSVVRQGISEGEYVFIIGDPDNTDNVYFSLRVEMFTGDGGVYDSEGMGAPRSYLRCREK